MYEAMHTCVGQRAIDAINSIGLQGGYIQPPEDSLNTEFSTIAFGLRNGKNILLTQERIEEEIENYLVSTLPFCLSEDDFPDFDIVMDEIHAKTTIKEDQIEFTVNAPLSIRKEEKITQLKNPYEITIPIRLGKMHQTANEIIERQKSEGNYLSLSYLSEREFEITTISINEMRWIYVITDDSQINRVYSFSFAVDVPYK